MSTANEFLKMNNINHVVMLLSKFFYDKYSIKIFDDINKDELSALTKEVFTNIAEESNDTSIERMNIKAMSMMRDRIKQKYPTLQTFANIKELFEKPPIPSQPTQQNQSLNQNQTLSQSFQFQLPPTQFPQPNQPQEIQEQAQSSQAQDLNQTLYMPPALPKYQNTQNDNEQQQQQQALTEDDYYKRIRELDNERNNNINKIINPNTQQPQFQTQFFQNNTQNTQNTQNQTTFNQTQNQNQAFVINSWNRNVEFAPLRNGIVWSGPLNTSAFYITMERLFVPNYVVKQTPYIVVSITGAGGKTVHINAYPTDTTTNTYSSWMQYVPIASTASFAALSSPWTVLLLDAYGDALNLGEDVLCATKEHPDSNYKHCYLIQSNSNNQANINMNIIDLYVGDKVLVDSHTNEIVSISKVQPTEFKIAFSKPIAIKQPIVNLSKQFSIVFN